MKFPSARPFDALSSARRPFLDAAAAHGLDLKVDALLLQRLDRSFSQSAAARKAAPEAGGVVQIRLLKLCQLNIAAVQHGLKLLKGHHAVNIFAHAGSCASPFFAVQGPMNIVFASLSMPFMNFAIVAIGDMLCDTFSDSIGNCLCT